MAKVRERARVAKAREKAREMAREKVLGRVLAKARASEDVTRRRLVHEWRAVLWHRNSLGGYKFFQLCRRGMCAALGGPFNCAQRIGLCFLNNRFDAHAFLALSL